jgi:hypothetical protein
MKQPEEWKAMKEFDELYHISNHGRVRSYVVDKVDGRIIVPKKKPNGYWLYVIKFKGHYKSFYTHRRVGEYFVPNPNGYETVDHIKNDKDLNQAWELQWMDQIDNVRKDQARIVICISPLGTEYEAEGTRNAAQIASCNRSSVQYSLKNGGVTITGWRFKYKKR